MSAESVRVTICGNEYSIKADVDVDTTTEIAEYVDRQMMEFQKNTPLRDKLKIAVLSAMNIAGELHEYKGKCEDAENKLTEYQAKTREMSRKIKGSLK